MIQCRRSSLQHISVGQAEHPGLWLDKYLSRQLKREESVPVGEKTPQQRLVEECASIGTPGVYGEFYGRWRTALSSLGARTVEAQVQGRLAIGLGGEGVIETAITLHHTYGVPYIPGSALKGLAASYAHQRLGDPRWRQDGDAHTVVFGTTEDAGFVTFFDALYVPGSGHGGQALHPDVITVHHPGYYQQGNVAPADWDNPNPVSFLSTTGKYLVALTGPSTWVEAAFRILELALAEVGVGAKTSSGYGRLRWVVSSDSPGEATEIEIPPGYQRGRVKTFGLGRHESYGFIYSSIGGPEIFVHVKGLAEGVDTLHADQEVIFKVVKGRQGPQAEDVRPLQ